MSEKNTTDQKAKPAGDSPPKDGIRFVASFVHWRSGETIRAEDYGLKAFPIGRGK